MILTPRLQCRVPAGMLPGLNRRCNAFGDRSPLSSPTSTKKLPSKPKRSSTKKRKSQNNAHVTTKTTISGPLISSVDLSLIPLARSSCAFCRLCYLHLPLPRSFSPLASPNNCSFLRCLYTIHPFLDIGVGCSLALY